ncbi:MAG: hypothetical protein HN730_07025, partial [Bdellovibrionales bacterium]|nr:hypothetical protein [Bdellovibrionales bacterium]
MVRGRIIQRSCILLATLSLAWWGAAAWHLLHQKYDDLAFYQQNVAAHEFSEVANSVQALVAQGNLADARRYIIKWISEHHRSHRVIVKMENGADLIKASAQEERKEEKRVDRQVKPLSAIIWYRGAKLWTVTVWSQQNFAAKEEYSIILFRWTVLLVFTLLASFFIWYRYRYDRGDQLKSAIDQAPVDLINVDSNIALAQQQEQLALLRYFYQQLANNSTSRQIERVLEICLQMNEQGKMVISQERFGILLTECHKGFDYQE